MQQSPPESSDGRLELDWRAVASLLAAHSRDAFVLLDPSGRICLSSAPFERLLGMSTVRIAGQHWATVCAPSHDREGAQRWIAEALRGELREYETTLVTSTGAHLATHLECLLVGGHSARGLLVAVTEARPVQVGAGPFDGEELDYTVSLTELGALTKLATSNGRVLVEPPGQRCYALMYGRNRPCDECPLIQADDAPWPRVSVRRRPHANGVGFELKTASKLDASLARIQLRVLSEAALVAIHAAKVDDLATQANLSAREREVLSYLLLARSIEDIARAIGITPRTVKYHQANVLQKLGADSRADLLRLLF